MSDKKNEITDEEMKSATGGGASDASDRVTDRAGHSGSPQADARGDARSGAVQADALTDHKLDSVQGGTSTTPGQVKTKSDFYRDNASEVEGSGGGGGNKRIQGSLGGQVK